MSKITRIRITAEEIAITQVYREVYDTPIVPLRVLKSRKKQLIQELAEADMLDAQGKFHEAACVRERAWERYTRPDWKREFVVTL